MQKVIGIIIILVGIINVSCCSQKFEITGSTEQLDKGDFAQRYYKPTNGKYIYLMKNINGERVKVDSCILKNNRFHFEGEVDNVEVLTLKLANKVYFSFFAENNKMTVRVPLQQSEPENPIVRGSETDKRYREYKKKIQEIFKPAVDFRKSFGNKPSKEEKAQIHRLDWKVLKIAEKVKYDFIENNPNTVISPYLLLERLYGADPKKLRKYYSLFTDEVKKSPLGKEVFATITSLEGVLTGHKAPNFKLIDINNKEVSLADFRGKCVLIDFWGSYCGPCKASFPYLKELYGKYKDKGFEIIGITLDRDENRWKETVKKCDIPWVQLSNIKSKSKIFNTYNVVGIPFTYLIDKNGLIVKKNPHGEEIEKELKKILNE